MRKIPICLLMVERFLEEPPTTMIPSLFFNSLAMIFPTSATFFICVGSVELLIKTKSDTVFLISSSFQSKQKSSGNISPLSVFPMSNLDVFHIYKTGSPSSFNDWKKQKIYTRSPTEKPLRNAVFGALSGYCQNPLLSLVIWHKNPLAFALYHLAKKNFPYSWVKS